MLLVDIEIQGVTPLLQHRFTEEAQVAVGKNTRPTHIQSETPRDVATKHAYVSDDGTLYHPIESVLRALRESGGNHKQRGSRKTLKWIVPAAILMVDAKLSLLDGNRKPAKTFEVDSRPVVIPATKGRVMRHRPRLDVWFATFTLRINEALMEPETAHLLLTEAGVGIGIGDFRPEKGGPYGTFQVTSWKVRK